MAELKYAVVERERRWLLPGPPSGLRGEVLQIADRYLTGTRLRLRQVTAEDGSVVRKLGHKVRFGEDATEIAHTSMYLDEDEWSRLSGLDGRPLSKRRTRLRTSSGIVVVDVYGGNLVGLVTAEVDGGDRPAGGLPSGWRTVAEVTLDERYAGAALAAADRPPTRD